MVWTHSVVLAGYTTPVFESTCDFINALHTVFIYVSFFLFLKEIVPVFIFSISLFYSRGSSIPPEEILLLLQGLVNKTQLGVVRGEQTGDFHILPL